MLTTHTLIAASWGTVPDWLGAIGTVGTLFIALYLLKYQMDDRKHLIAARKMAVARAVSAWYDKSKIHVRNGAEEPVYNCMVYADPLGDDALAEGRTHGIEVLFGTIPPSSVLDYTCTLETEHFGVPPVEVEFTDARGKHWHRDGSGKLQSVESRRPFC